MFDDSLGIFANDADIEQRQLEEAGNRISRLRQQGICLHGHLQNTKCLECGKTWETEEKMWDEIEGLRLEYL